MGTYDKYETDPQLEKDGVLLDLGESGAFIVARAGGANDRYTRRVRALTKPYRRQINNDSLDPSVADRLAIQAFAETILVRWLKKGEKIGSFTCEHDVTDRDGKPMAHNLENAKKLLTDLPDLFADIRSAAQSESAYLRQVVAEEGKPSAPPSSTT